MPRASTLAFLAARCAAAILFSTALVALGTSISLMPYYSQSGLRSPGWATPVVPLFAIAAGIWFAAPLLANGLGRAEPSARLTRSSAISIPLFVVALWFAIDCVPALVHWVLLRLFPVRENVPPPQMPRHATGPVDILLFIVAVGVIIFVLRPANQRAKSFGRVMSYPRSEPSEEDAE
jgi:hypothetical protein